MTRFRLHTFFHYCITTLHLVAIYYFVVSTSSNQFKSPSGEYLNGTYLYTSNKIKIW